MINFYLINKILWQKIILLRIIIIILIIFSNYFPSIFANLKPIIIDEGKCPLGWSPVGINSCVQLNFLAKRANEAAIECKKIGAELIDFLIQSNQIDKALIQDLSHLINEAYEAGIIELTWIIGGNSDVLLKTTNNDQINNKFSSELWLENVLKSDSLSYQEYNSNKNIIKSTQLNLPNQIYPNLPNKTIEMDKNYHENNYFALRKRLISNENFSDENFEIITINGISSFPFICSLLPLRRKTLIYEQALLPQGAPKIISESDFSPLYYTGTNLNGRENFLRLPCNAIGEPKPIIKWYQNGKNEEINVNIKNSPFIISGGSLLINNSKNYIDIFSFHCTATNIYGTVRSSTIIVRPIFIDSFRETRLDVYPLSSRRSGSQTTGTRIDCQAPNHYPKSYAYSWMYGDSSDQFVQVNERIFISMDGTLYFSYNLPEDANRYACTLTSTAKQSAQHGPFFRLILPSSSKMNLFDSMEINKTKSFPPKIDEFQPMIFPELPLRGQTIYIECFAYGYPAPTYKWSRVDGVKFSSRVRLLNYGRVLRIDNVKSKDAVRYKCSAKNNLGQVSTEIQLIIQSPPTILRAMSNQLISENHSTIFNCLIRGDSNGNGLSGKKGHLTIEWFRNGHPIVPILMNRKDRHRFKISNNELRIYKAQQPNDEGVYQCIVSNDVGSVSTSALLKIQNFPPIFHANIFPSKIFAVEGIKLTLPCLYHASPRGQAQWRRLGNNYNNNNNQQRQLKLDFLYDKNNENRNELAILEFENIQLVDSGDYECLATNSMGEARAIVKINVLPATKAILTPENLIPSLISTDSKNLKLSCEVEINCIDEEIKTLSNSINYNKDKCPEALFEWKFNERNIRSLSLRKDGIKISQSEFNRRSTSIFDPPPSTFVDSSFKKPKNGTFFHYTLPLTKRLYRTEMEISKEFARNNIGRFSCSSAFGSGAVAELEPDTKFHILAPIQIQIEEKPVMNDEKSWWDVNQQQQQRSIKLSWKRANFISNEKRRKSTKIIGYQIEYRTFIQRTWISLEEDGFVPSIENSEYYSYFLNNLEPNEKYQFRIRTRTSDGHLSIPSNSIWYIIPPSTPISTVTNLRHKILDDRHLLIEWDPIEINHKSGPNLRYNISWSSINSKDDSLKNFEIVKESSFVLILSNSSKAISTMNECNILAINVRPINDIGSGSMATEKLIYLTNDGPKRKAVNTELYTINGTHLNFTWNWIINTGDCENVFGAQITCNELDSIPIMNSTDSNKKSAQNILIKQSIPVHYNHWLIHSLRPLTNYSCSITAFDHFGRFGEASSKAYASTNQPAPIQPPEIIYVRLKNVEDGKYAILIDWNSIELNSIVDNKNSNSNFNNSTGYKIYVYVTETAQDPIELILYESQLQNTKKPSAQIDGLKTMFYYSIQIAGFNTGGLGPRSRPIPIRIGAAQNDLNENNNFNILKNSSNSAYSLKYYFKKFSIIFWLFILLRNFFLL